jgi:signal transduction histidine kinase
MSFTTKQETIEALLQAELPILPFLEWCSDGVVVEGSGQWLYANPAAARLLGLPDPQSLLLSGAAEGKRRIESFRQSGKGEVVVFAPGPAAPAATAPAVIEVYWLRGRENGRDPRRQQAIGEALWQTQARLQLFKSISQRINAGMDAPALIARTLREAHKIFPRLRISFGSLEGQDRFRILDSAGPADMPDLSGLEGDWSATPFLSEGLLLGQILVFADVTRDPRLAPLAGAFATMGTRAWILVPVRQARGTGFLSLGSGQPRAWSEHEVATLADMAEFLTIALRESDREGHRQKMEEHLREAQKREAISRLVGGLAHDFNNLLTAMMVYAGLLGNALGRDHALHRHIDEIRTAGERGAQLVEQMLALSRQQVLEPRIIDLRDSLTEMKDMLTRVLGEDIVLELEPGDEARVKVDPGQIQQVILNLALNARDAMPSGGRLRLATSALRLSEEDLRQDPDLVARDYIALIVADTGMGMDAETRQHLFDPFFTTKGHGHGLGLASVLGIVKQHKGSIRVESAPGQGTTVRILLPAARADEDEARRVQGPMPDPGAPRILLVEDEDNVRRSLVETLEADGYRVAAAVHGPAALALLSSTPEPFDLIITDLVMPHMSGREFAERVLALDPEVPVMYISGYTDDPRTRELMSTAAYFCRKPFTPEALLRKVRQILLYHPPRRGEAEPGDRALGLGP